MSISIAPQFGGGDNFPRHLHRDMWTRHRWEGFVKRFNGSTAEWQWNGRIGQNEYGKIETGLESPKYISAHIAAYIIAHGERPEGYEVRHRCGEGKLCCNPKHLYLHPSPPPKGSSGGELPEAA